MDSFHPPLPPSRARTRILITMAGGPRLVGLMFDPPISSQAVSQWARVPAERCLVIEQATQGRISRRQLRPDLYDTAPQEAA
jgi:DNA-binding transcriptional regulator YdaS (Cro superfamily)